MLRILFAFLLFVSVNAVAESRHQSIDNLSIEYMDIGRGDYTLVIESGVGMGVAYWQPFIKQINKLKVRTIIYSRAGNGSSTPSSQNSLDESSIRLHKLLTALNAAENLLLLGHSFGALHSRRYAARYQEDVAGLILIEPSHELFQNELETLDHQWAEKDNLQLNKMLQSQQEWTILQSIYQRKKIKDNKITQTLPTVIVTSSRLGESDWWIGHSIKGKNIWRSLHSKLINNNQNSVHIVVEHVGHNIPIEDVDLTLGSVKLLLRLIKSK